MTAPGTVRLQAHGRTVDLGFDDPDDHIARVIRGTGAFYEAEMLADVRSRLFFPRRAVDVGAHVGNHALFFSRVLDMETVAFEPDPANFRRLSANVAANDAGHLCVLRNVGLGAAPSRARAAGGAGGNSGMRALAADPDGTVEISTLDAETGDLTGLDVLKVDVEGWELEVLRGAARTLRRHRPLVYVETGEATFPDLRSFMEAAGFVAWKRFNSTPTVLFLPRERLGRE